MAAKPITCVDEYIKQATPQARPVLERIRGIVKAVAPRAEEVISYRLPAFRQGRVFFYFAAFKTHIGIYPPVQADGTLEEALRAYRGQKGTKGNLKFALDQPMPYPLIRRVAVALKRQYAK